MTKRFKLFTPLSCILLLMFMVLSCEKPEGEGGYTTVKGNVWVRDYNSTFTVLAGEYAGADEDVYIIYGDESGYSDKTSTDYLGRFSFRYLRPGNYTVYVYSKDSTLSSISGEVAVVQQFTIEKGDELVELPQFLIFN
ncbi:MAG TPA: hypothetical protein PLZ52_10330 [Bacteroidales bacterium]|nr:hypothetical protein [Bacteroidales bacterium]HQL71003.1 hypothetical protein [Bacteroidales bacterium]